MQLGAIQSLRAVAALMVVFHHLLNEMARLAGGSAVVAALSPLLPLMAGVDIFFVISGFIMVHASAGMAGQGGAAWLFLRRRLIRIVPLYWVMTAVVAVLAMLMPGRIAGGSPEWPMLIGSFLFWPVAWPDGLVQPVLTLGWTLNYEMLFYGLFALALAATGRIFLVAALATAGLLALTVLAELVPSLPFSFWGQPIILEFAFGMALGLARLSGLRLGGWVRLALALAAFAALLAAPRGIGYTSWHGALFHGGPALMLVAAAALGRDRRSVFSPRWLERLGDASYALYLTHPVALKSLSALFLAGGFSAAVYFPLAIIGCCVLALMVYRFFEAPVTAWLRRRLSV
jgi:peptidoglycan/LPS O-acetylase OafA/YrhL